MYQCMVQPIYQTLEPHLCSQPQSPPETRPSHPLSFFRNRRRRICHAGAGTVGGGGQARWRRSTVRTADVGMQRTSAVGISSRPVAGLPLASSPLPHSRLHGTPV
jgi:hypothetical protein